MYRLPMYLCIDIKRSRFTTRNVRGLFLGVLFVFVYTLVNHISFVHSSRRVVRLQDLFKRKRYEVLAKDVLNMHFT